MAPTYFPLRWESTGDQWWYASPIDWAAANGHYDLVRELIRIDNNHLISLTSLRRIRRLETVWDDEEQFHDVAKCRSKVAKKLFQECEYKRGKNSLIQASYGGWLMYTAASAGDLSFVQDLLQRNPLLVFGEGEYGVTDIFYAAARSKNSNVFRLVYDFAVSPRFLTSQGGELVEQIGDIPPIYKWEMMNRAVHAAARGGNSTVLKELLSNCSDVLAYRDKHGSTVLHAAASRGQVEVINELVSRFDIINSTDNLGNTVLHIAAYRGQSSAVEALITAAPSLISSTNNAGETFLHAAISGFSTPAFRRLDRQIHLMNKLMSAKVPQFEDIVNAKNNEGRTPLHMAIIANLHSELVQLLMSAPSINVNARDADGMTPLDLLRQRPRSVSSDILIRQLISAGGIFGCQDYIARRAIASRLKMQGNGGSPGTSFRISDMEIFLYTGIEISSDSRAEPAARRVHLSSSELNQLDQTDENHVSATHMRRSSVNYAAQRLKMILHWPKVKEKMAERSKKPLDHNSMEPFKKCNGPEVTPTPLRQRFSKPSSSPSPVPNNKRALSVRSNQTSPTPKKKLASGLMHGVMQAAPQANMRGRSRSNSFSKSSVSSSGSADKQKGVAIECSIVEPGCSNELTGESRLEKEGTKHKRTKSQYFCFGGSVETPVIRHGRNLSANSPMVSVA